MKTILKIAWHELKLLFCSPIAWMLLIIFLYQFSSVFVATLADPDGALRLYHGYTHWLFSGSLFPEVEGKIYFYIPLLTMGLLSQELNTGSIKLLFSSPIKTRSIVFGKYLGIMAYWMIVILLFIVLSAPSYFLLDNLDLGIVLPGILAVFLLACTYSAIGLFMSCLTSYQVVAALGTLSVLAALNYIGGMWQGVPVLKDVINFLHIAGHAENMNEGFIKSRDVLYFIIITGLFLGLATYYLEDTIRFRPKMARVKRYVLFTAGMLLLGCLVSTRQATLYFDTTAIKFHTISPTSQELLKKIKGPVSMTTYSNLLDKNGEIGTGMPENRKRDFGFWEPYIRFLPQLKLEYVNYYHPQDTMGSPARVDSIASYYAAQRGWYIEDFLKPQEIGKVIDLKAENYGFIRKVKAGNKEHYIRVFKDLVHVPTEQEIMTAFNGMLTDYIRIGFLTGHYERSVTRNEDRDYKFITNEGTNRYALLNMGYDVVPVPVTGVIPDNLQALVIGDPLTAYTAEEQEKIKAYIAKGGNVLITCGPKSQDILNPVTADLGVKFMKGQLVQRSEMFTPEIIFTNVPMREGGDPYPFQFSLPLAMPESVGLQYTTDKGFKVEEAVVTDESNTWSETGEIPVDTAELRLEPARGDVGGTLPVALSLTRNTGKKEQRIMVVGNGSFMSNWNLGIDYNEKPHATMAFALAAFKWLGNGNYPIVLKPLAGSKDVELLFTKEWLLKMKPWYIWTLPALIFVTGLIFLLRRRRK